MQSTRTPAILCGAPLLAVFAAAAGTATAQYANDVPAAIEVRAQANDGALSVSARDATVERVLESIVRETGLRAMVHGTLDRRVSLEFHDLPLTETLRRILTEESFVLRVVNTDATSARDGRRVTLWVFESDASQVPVRTARRLGSSSGSTGDTEALNADIVNGDARERARALRGLRKLDDGDAVRPISVALGDDEADIRVEAIYALSDIGGGDAAASLTGALFDENPWVRQEAVFALGAAGGEAAIDALRPALRDAEIPVRESAIEAYAAIGGDKSARALGEVLDDEEHSVRMSAVLALGELGGAVAFDLLKRAIEDEDPYVREAAADALAEIDGEQAARVLEQAIDHENAPSRETPSPESTADIHDLR